MKDPKSNDATTLLSRIQNGDSDGNDQLLALIYDELRKLAAHKMANEAPGQTLQPTALVHEAWLRIIKGKEIKFANRAHFFSAAAEAMRRILIERARRKGRQRHGSAFQRVEFEEGLKVGTLDADDQMLALNDALDKLAEKFPRQAQVVQLRYFGGLTNEQAADVIGVSLATVKSDWTFSRTWLFQEMKESPAS
jgi:RNA polymerase sigma factor (TIGR02999 family)